MREGSAPGIAFLLPNSEFLIRWATPNRETNGGMRRCQRLPDVTHPVDSTRPAASHIKSRASCFARIPCGIVALSLPPSCAGDALTSRQNGLLDPLSGAAR